MAALFDIVGEFQQLYEMATSDDVDPEVFEGTLESLTGELEVKGAGYVAVIGQLEMEESKADELSKKYAAIRDSRKNAIKRMKDRLLFAMDSIGKTEIDAGEQKIKVQKNGGKQPMDVDKENVPQNYMRVVYEPDNDKIRKDLEDGKNLNFAELKPRGKHIVIR